MKLYKTQVYQLQLLGCCSSKPYYLLITQQLQRNEINKTKIDGDGRDCFFGD